MKHFIQTMSNTLVSVVLYTYNGDKFLAEQIDSFFYLVTKNGMSKAI